MIESVFVCDKCEGRETLAPYAYRPHLFTVRIVVEKGNDPAAQYQQTICQKCFDESGFKRDQEESFLMEHNAGRARAWFWKCVEALMPTKKGKEAGK